MRCAPLKVLSGNSPPLQRRPPPGPFSAAGIGTGTRAISGLWQFHLGDDPAWAQPGFDDHSWEQLPADQPWGDAGHPGYAGFAWYRRQITLDPADKKPLALLLPPVASVAEVYWNGVKVGGIGTPPPHAEWPHNPEPVAIPLPLETGARSGELAIRVWEHRLASTDAPDAGGFQAVPQLGFRSLIQAAPQQWWEHRLRSRALSYARYLLFLCGGVGALILWLRSRAQWLLLTVATSLLSYACQMLLQGPLTHRTALLVGETMTSVRETAGLFLVLLLADLPKRSGIRGARFWWRACILFSAVELLECFLDAQRTCS